MRLVGATNTPCRELGKTRREAIRTLERFLVRAIWRLRQECASENATHSAHLNRVAA